jgi:hypothetical protein
LAQPIKKQLNADAVLFRKQFSIRETAVFCFYLLIKSILTGDSGSAFALRKSTFHFNLNNLNIKKILIKAARRGEKKQALRLA